MAPSSMDLNAYRKKSKRAQSPRIVMDQRCTVPKARGEKKIIKARRRLNKTPDKEDLFMVFVLFVSVIFFVILIIISVVIIGLIMQVFLHVEKIQYNTN